MVYVPFDSHFQRTCQSLEYPLNLMVLILPFSLYVEVHLCGIAKTLEEVKEHLCWHLPKSRATWHRQSSIGRQ